MWESLRDEYGGRLNVVYLLERDHPLLGMRYQVRSIPTLLFFDKAGKEVRRHQGMLPAEEIRKKLAELGVRQAP